MGTRNEQEFQAWMKMVNSVVEAQCGLGIDDLPDWDYSSAFEDEMDYTEAADYVLENAGWF